MTRREMMSLTPGTRVDDHHFGLGTVRTQLTRETFMLVKFDFDGQVRYLDETDAKDLTGA